MCKNSLTSKSCFARMQQVPQKNYIASVENAIEAIRSIGEHEYNSVSVNGKLGNPIQADSGKVVLVTFDDETDASRDTCLESHGEWTCNFLKVRDSNLFFEHTYLSFRRCDCNHCIPIGRYCNVHVHYNAINRILFNCFKT